MPKPQDQIIPLPIAQAFLTTFGITQNSQSYDRWVRPDGVKLEDFSQVLFESPFIFIIDWRAVLEEEIPAILAALSQLGCNISFQSTDDVSGVLSTPDGRQLGINYSPNEGEGFDVVIASFQQLVPSEIEFREAPDNAGNDTWTFAVLKRDHWHALESLDQDLLHHFFVPIHVDPPPQANPPVRGRSQGFFDSLFQGPKSAWLKTIGAGAIGALIGLKGAAEMKDTSDRVIAVAGGAFLGALAAGILVYNDWALDRQKRLGLPKKPLGARLIGCMMIVGFTLGGISLLCAIIMGAIKTWHWLFGLLF